jgi:glycerol-3-phosphate acyltransferase PlsY
MVNVSGDPEEKNGNPSPWRRLWHVVGGSFFPVLGLFISRGWLLVFIGVALFLFVAWEAARFLSPGINRWMSCRLGLILKKKERFRPTGSTYLLLASLITFFFFHRYIAVTALLFLSVGDFLAAVIGQRYGRHRLFKKSLEGSLACLVACLIAGLLMAFTHSAISWLMALVGAFIATTAELLPVPIDDNLTIPLVSAGVMALLS